MERLRNDSRKVVDRARKGSRNVVKGNGKVVER